MSEEKNAGVQPGQVPPALGYAFARPQLATLALTHSSHANENGGEHNQRLEFLGDAVLELCVTAELFSRFPKAREGELTRMRSEMVKSATLAAVAESLGLGAALLLGRGEDAQAGRTKQSVLEDALEAMLGAIYLDGGLEAAREVVLRIFAGLWPRALPGQGGQDSKTRLQEMALRRLGGSPLYRLLAARGPAHAPSYEVELLLPDGRSFVASAPACKKAEHAAAALALAALGEEDAAESEAERTPDRAV